MTILIKNKTQFRSMFKTKSKKILPVRLRCEKNDHLIKRSLSSQKDRQCACASSPLMLSYSLWLWVDTANLLSKTCILCSLILKPFLILIFLKLFLDYSYIATFR